MRTLTMAIAAAALAASPALAKGWDYNDIDKSLPDLVKEGWKIVGFTTETTNIDPAGKTRQTISEWTLVRGGEVVFCEDSFAEKLAASGDKYELDEENEDATFQACLKLENKK